MPEQTIATVNGREVINKWVMSDSVIQPVDDGVWELRLQYMPDLMSDAEMAEVATHIAEQMTKHDKRGFAKINA
jgi:hypothetical protein